MWGKLKFAHQSPLNMEPAEVHETVFDALMLSQPRFGKPILGFVAQIVPHKIELDSMTSATTPVFPKFGQRG